MTELPGERRGEAGKKCVVQVVRVSGTIRKSEEELLRRARRDVIRAQAAEDGLGASVLDRLTAGPSTGVADKLKTLDDSIVDVDSDDELEDAS